MRGRIELTARGRLCLALLHLTAGAAWLTGDDNARLAASMLAAPFLVDWLYKLFIRPQVAVAVASRRTRARASFVESVAVHNASQRSVHDLRIGEPRTQPYDAGGAFLPTLAPKEDVRTRVVSRAPRRGIYAQRRFDVETSHPLGMLRWTGRADATAPMVVEPSRVDLPNEVLAELAAHRPESQSGDRINASEFHSLREYRWGEDARHVHGRRSASVGSLLTKVYRGNRDPECAIVVDLRRSPGIPVAHAPTLELQLSRAASLVDALLARGSGFRCAAIADEVRTWGSSEAAGSDRFLEFLARARDVPFRTIDDEALTALLDSPACFWIPAGGHAEPSATDRRQTRIVTAEAS